MSTEFIAATAPATKSTLHKVIVGFDGSIGAEAAVEWAACEAEQRDVFLRVLTCWAVPPEVDFYGAGRRQADSLAAIVAATKKRHPHLVVSSSATPMDPRDALIDEAAKADLLVIGSSTIGAARQLLLGSVAKTAARRSPCPVVVVRGAGVRPVRTIVVGIDGSSASAAAVDWACAEADFHRAQVVLIHAWEGDISRVDAQRVIDVAVSECHARTGAEVRGELVDGSPAAAIVRASRNADLVAIGSRGQSGFKTALFGSVALSVADQAACPVAITHPRLRQG